MATTFASGGGINIVPITRGTTVRDVVRDALRDLIISGGLLPDVPLRQDELATRLNVSRTPLREALHGLASEGLVTIDPRRGAMVSKPTVQQLLDLYEIREQLEVLAGRLAVAAAGTDHVDDITTLNRQMAEVTDPVAWAQLNQQFHVRLYGPCPNKELLNMISSLAERSKFYVRILVSSRPPADSALRGHQEMLNALRARDGDAMEIAVRRHLRSTVKQVSPVLPERSSESRK